MDEKVQRRCGYCEACRRVEKVKRQALRVLNDPKYLLTPTRTPVGEDVRLIWNRTLEENPCLRVGREPVEEAK